MNAPYDIDPEIEPSPQTVIDAGRGERWRYCPVCSAVYPTGSLAAVPCPNADQPDHADDRETGRRDPDTPAPAGSPSIAEIAALTGRLRHLRSPGATEAERAAFLADKHALLARIAATDAHRKD